MQKFKHILALLVLCIQASGCSIRKNPLIHDESG